MNIEFFDKIPENLEFNLYAPTGVEGNLSRLLDTAVRVVVFAGVFALIILLFLISLVIFRPWKRVLRWGSTALLVSSFNLAIIAAALIFVPDFLMPHIGLDTEEMQLYEQLYELFVKNFALELLIIVLPLLVISSLSFIFSFLIKTKKL